LNAARARLDSIAAARAEAIAARKACWTNKDSMRATEAPAAEEGSSTATKQMEVKSNNEASTRTEPSGTLAVLLEAQQRLRDIEIAAAAARRARYDAAVRRAHDHTYL